MKWVFKIIWNAIKVYLSALGIVWAFIGVGNYLDDVYYLYDEHGYVKEFGKGVLEVHTDHACRGIGTFCKDIKEMIVDELEGLF